MLNHSQFKVRPIDTEIVALSIDGEDIGALVEGKDGHVTIRLIQGYLKNGRRIKVVVQRPDARRHPREIARTDSYEDELRARGVL